MHVRVFICTNMVASLCNLSLSLSMSFIVFCMQIWIYDQLCLVVLCVLSSRMASDMLMIFDFDALLLQFDLKQNFAK